LTSIGASVSIVSTAVQSTYCILTEAHSRVRQHIWETPHKLCLIGIVAISVGYGHLESQIPLLVIQMKLIDVARTADA